MKLTQAAAAGGESSRRVCDLCHEQQPSVYCSSDSAFLCSDCDSHVHTANFLVARHIRFSINCNDDQDDDASSSISSGSSSTAVCLSGSTCSNIINSKTTTTTTTSATISSDWKTRNVLVDWCTRLIGGDSSGRVIIAEVARHAFHAWWLQRRVWPYRVGLAASLWLGIHHLLTTNNAILDNNNKRVMRMRQSILLKRLEEISGVPAKSILVTQSKLAAASTFKHRRRRQQQAALEESCGEC